MTKRREEIKTIQRLAGFLLLLIFLDVSMGSFYNYLFFEQRSGKFYRTTYAMEKSTDDILVFGSSNALQHYVPDVFENELKGSFYNAGSLGQGLLYAKAVEDVILKRHKPKLIILNLDQKMMHKDSEILSRLAMLRPYYNKHPEIRPYLEIESKLERFKQFSRLYPFNSTILHLIRYAVAPQQDFAGYLPKFGVVSDKFVAKPLGDLRWKKTLPALDERNISALDNFIADALLHKIQIAVVISPLYKEATFFDQPSMEAIKKIVAKHNVELWDYSKDPFFHDKNEFFYDLYHLNDKGANIFSKMISTRLKNADKWPEENLMAGID